MSSSKDSKSSKGKKGVKDFLPPQDTSDYFNSSAFIGSRHTQLLRACPELQGRVMTFQRTESDSDDESEARATPQEMGTQRSVPSDSQPSDSQPLGSVPEGRLSSEPEGTSGDQASGSPDVVPQRRRRTRKSNFVAPPPIPREPVIIRPVGKSSWWDSSYVGQKYHRTVNGCIGNLVRLHYPGAIDGRAATSWDDYARVPHQQNDNLQGVVWADFWLRYRLEDPIEQTAHARSVFEVNARKLVMQMLSNARIQVVNNYLKLHDHEVGSFRDATGTYLTEEQYAEVSVPWLQGRTEDYRALCRYWASDEFIAKSKKAREARGSSGKHRMGVQGFVRMAKRMETETGVRPSATAVYRRGHADPSHPEQCNQHATERPRCRDSSVIQHEATITVHPDLDTRCYQICSIAGCPVNNTPVEIRIGLPVRCLSVISVDMFGNRTPFLDTSSVTITVLGDDDVLAQVDDTKVELSADSLTLNVMEFMFRTIKVDALKPMYEAKLKISSFDNEFYAMCPCKVKPGFPSTIKMDMSLFPEKDLIPGRVIDNALLEVFDHCGNHVEEGIELNVHVDGFSFLDNLGPVRKVNAEGFVNLCGTLSVVGSFGSQACMTISHREKKIFSGIFEIATRQLKATSVPESCPSGSVLENIVFEVSDSDGLVDESIDGPLHTLKITSDGLPLLEEMQYMIQHGKCVLSHIQLPNKSGIVTILAYHTHYPDLQTKIQLRLNSFDIGSMSLEDGPEPILGYPISSVANSDVLLRSLTSHLVTYTKGVIEETSNKIQDTSSRISSTEKALKVLYAHKETLEKEIFILKGEIGHTAGRFIVAKEVTRSEVMKKVGTAAYVLCSSGERFMNYVVGIVALLGTVADDKISRMLATYLGKDDMLAVVCKTLDAANFIEKYLANGTIDDGFGIHREAAALGAPIDSRFPIICLDAIEPYKGGLLWNSPQKELALVWPFPHSKQPSGFKGFAVNMINLSNENLNMTTGSGYGLRETLFYSLFGELQVYETRNDMLQAMPYLKDGAISLDGGVIKGKGKLLLGSSEPKITFPVVTPSPAGTLNVPEASQDDVVGIEKIRQIDAIKDLLAEVKRQITKIDKDRQELIEKHEKKKRKFNQISEVFQPFSSLIDQCTPVQTPEERTQVQQTPQEFICKKERDMDMHE